MMRAANARRKHAFHAGRPLNLAAGIEVVMDTIKVPATAKRKPPAAGKGRPKGALNKTTSSAKEAIARAAEKLGGADRIVAWAKEDPANERVFWGTIYPKLLPLQVTGEGGGPVQLILNGSDVNG
jgi:hypothetical protein